MALDLLDVLDSTVADSILESESRADYPNIV
jgi:hypothetical protein